MPQGWQGRGKKRRARKVRRQRHVYRRIICKPEYLIDFLGKRGEHFPAYKGVTSTLIFGYYYVVPPQYKGCKCPKRG
jgi:hypothetical protein